ncbi:hypothetical protein [Mycobacterium sp. E2699]|uniref:hypothetical protein n=1 Tax=Mycobacterium sp. E2699 TaxID=1834137 RepID=UPI000AB70A99|nr:hypothetical protein [Mycobacterium sp. E2699]
MADQAGRSEIRSIFERGAVYADRWTAEVRAALDVPDELADVVAASLAARRSVVVAGNAGDGKSHLAQCALDRLATRTCFEVTRDSPVPLPVPKDSVIFIRDASSLSDGEILATVKATEAADATLLLTINEGPLSSLAQASEDAFFPEIREVLHRRAMGDEEPDEESEFLVINLAGRQLPRSAFAIGALEKLLPVAATSPCSTCRDSSSKACPRVVGAKMLRASKTARGRIGQLLKMLSDGGRHLSAREVWVYLIDLFFGWTCPPGGDEVDRLHGYFWMQIFEAANRVAGEISVQFDPVTVPMAREDVDIWQGRFGNVKLDSVEYPGPVPSIIAREDEDRGLEAFECAKRCYFFFGRRLDVASLLSRKSSAPEYGRMLEDALSNPRPIVRDLVRRINRYRLEKDTENDLWITRQHGLTAHRRPSALASTGKQPIDSLELRVPYAREYEAYQQSGFFPTQVFLTWADSDQYLLIDFDTWVRLGADRVLTVDRGQETLDFAVDLFLSQAGIAATEDPEVHIFDHRTSEATQLRIRPEKLEIEVIN